MRRALPTAAATVLALSLLVPGRASAVPGVNEVWTAAFSYVPHVVVLNQGTPLTLRNMEPVPDPIFSHNVTSLVPTLAPFASANVPPGGSGTVSGTNVLAPGVYPFTCTVNLVHLAAPTLKGLLVVVP